MSTNFIRCTVHLMLVLASLCHINAQSVGFENNVHLGAFWEACRSDDIKLRLTDFTFAPIQVSFPNSNNSRTIVSGADITIGATTCAPKYCGELVLRVPNDAVTGTIRIEGTTPTQRSPHLLMIVNPVVELASLPTTMCISDTIALSATPSGGIFTCSEGASYIQNAAGSWTSSKIFVPDGVINNGANSKKVKIVYSYTPLFQTNSSLACVARTIEDSLVVLNDKFTAIEFDSIGLASMNAATPIPIPTLISKTIPAIIPNGVGTDTVFTGTGVYPGTGTAPDSFYASNIGTYTIMAKSVNQGCESVVSGTIKVTNNLVGTIYGIASTQCALDMPTVIVRDTSVVMRRDSYPNIDGSYTLVYRDWGISNVISARGAITVNNGVYTYDPSLVSVPPSNPTSYQDTLVVYYAYIYERRDSNHTTIYSYNTHSTVKRAVITIQRKITPHLDSVIMAAYCKNVGIINLSATPANGNYSIKHINGIRAGNIDTLTTPVVITDTLHWGETSNTDYRLTYAVGIGNCRDSIQTDFRIVAPITPTFIGRHAYDPTPNRYCANELIDLLQATPTGGQFTGTGIIPSTSVFNPALAVSIGTPTITYTYTDAYGCVSSVSDTFTVVPLPLVSLQSNHTSNNDEFCDNEDAVLLTGQPSNGVIAILGTAGGLLQGTRYNINGIAGAVTFEYTATDALGCQNKDTLRVMVRPTSRLTMLPADTQFCRNAADRVFTISGNIPTAGSRRDTGYWVSTGSGFLANTNYYRPSNVRVTSNLDTIYYYHTNVYGCSDTTVRILHIDTIPQPIIQIARDTYCINHSAITLRAVPSRNLGQSGIFAGAGVRADTLDITQAGTGRRTLSYTFKDNRGCTGIGYDTIQIMPLPPANFGALDSQFCEHDTFRILIQTQLAFGTGVFSGNGIGHDTLYLNTFTPGDKYITYTFTDTFGCTSTSTRSFRINALPDVRLIGLASAYCANDVPVAIAGVPSNSNPATRFITVGGLTTVGNGAATFTPNQANLSTPITIRYEYKDLTTNCINHVERVTRVYPVPTVTLNNLPTSVCATATPIVMRGMPAGGTFWGMGLAVVGVQHDSLIPSRIGAGVHHIRYIVSDTPTAGLVCTNYDEDTIQINPLPLPTITAPVRADYCTSDTMYLLTGGLATNNVTLDTLGRFQYFSGVGVRDSITLRPVQTPWGNINVQDTIYYFDPSRATQGSHRIKYEVTTTTGCTDSTFIVYDVYRTEIPQLITAGRYCESDTLAVLVGIPAGGRFLRRSGGVRDTISNGFYHPNPTYPTTLLAAAKHDTLIYEYITGLRCIGRDTDIVVVNPIPQVDFIGINQRGDTTIRSCIGTDTINLIPIPNRVGGVFSGSGVLYQTTRFLPSIATAGKFAVRYEYTDTSTMCSNNKIHDFEAYNVPQLNLSVVGGCGDASVVLKTDSATGLSGIFAGTGTLFDSITLVRWTFGDGTMRNDMPIRTAMTNYIDTVQHLYTASGVYTVHLDVINRNYCPATDSLRVVISPSVSPTIAAPYDETFENSNGGWFDELEGSNSASNLWSWGVAQGAFINTTNNQHNKVWTTASTTPSARSYGNASGWVYSPCFDLTQLTRPMISLDYFMNMDAGNDGVVIEYFNQHHNKWLPLGMVDRGLNWYNEDVVAGRPGIQDLAPIGWSGEKNIWQNGRYKLDEFKRYQNWQFRIAFGASGVQTRNLEGFAFDNVWIGNRTRNVLVEHFANLGEADMNNINRRVYDTCYHNDYVRDVVLIQPHFQSPGYDEFYDEASAANNVRTSLYGMDFPAYTVIDGRGDINNRSQSKLIKGEDFERDMLETPAFMIRIPTVQVTGNQLHVEAIIKANQNLTTPLPYFGYIAVTEDSLEYASSPNTFVQSVLRELMPNNGAGALLPTTWAAGDSVTISGDWNFTWGQHNPDNFEIVVFVQTTTNGTSTTVYQVQTTRDISQYVGVVSPEVIAQSQEAEAAILYPNPAEERFNVSFEKPLSRDYNWKLVDIHGREIVGGIAQAGTQQLEVSDYDVASGMYFFVMYTKDFVTRRKVMLSRP